MELPHWTQWRTERLVAAGRAVLAAASLLAVWFDPSTPAAYAELTYSLLALYLVYALSLTLLVWIVDLSEARFGLATHAVDLPIFGLFMYLTEGPNSPFFVYFLFSLLSAALRWKWTGIIWTAAATLAIFIGLGLHAQTFLPHAEFELDRFIIRVVYFALMAVLLGALSAHEDRLREELAKLAAWPRHASQETLVGEALRQTAAIFGTPRVLLTWEEAEEPWRYVATHFNGEFRSIREAPSEEQPIVAEALAGSNFLCRDARRTAAPVLYTSADGLYRWRGEPLSRHFRERFAISSVLCARVSGDIIEGRLFVLDKAGMTSDDLFLAEVVARQVATDLDQAHVRQRLQQAAVAEDRVRFARDLHDGVLQSLTGLGLQLKAAERLVETDPQSARRQIEKLQTLIAAEQRDLRFFVEQMRPIPLGLVEKDGDLAAYLDNLGERMERQWGLQVEVAASPVDRRLPETLTYEIYRMVQEALANAVRHGRASTARVALATRDDEIRVTVTDNGRGFDFRGRRDLATLTLAGSGPTSLRERIASLGGNLVIDSTASGARLEISVPLARDEAGDPLRASFRAGEC
jgi:signal transduction histidine kinase